MPRAERYADKIESIAGISSALSEDVADLMRDMNDSNAPVPPEVPHARAELLEVGGDLNQAAMRYRYEVKEPDYGYRSFALGNNAGTWVLLLGGGAVLAYVVWRSSGGYWHADGYSAPCAGCSSRLVALNVS